MSDISVSNQSQHAFWNDPTISDAPIFVVADFVWGPDEAHYSPHRFIVSSYVRTHSTLLGGADYYLEDQYMTVRRYDSDGNMDILAAEKPEILERLRRAKAGVPHDPSPR